MPLEQPSGTNTWYVVKTHYKILFTLLLDIIAIKNYFPSTYKCTFNRISFLLTDNTTVNDYCINQTRLFDDALLASFMNSLRVSAGEPLLLRLLKYRYDLTNKGASPLTTSRL